MQPKLKSYILSNLSGIKTLIWQNSSCTMEVFSTGLEITSILFKIGGQWVMHRNCNKVLGFLVTHDATPVGFFGKESCAFPQIPTITYEKLVIRCLFDGESSREHIFK
jgi:hypothetical protein